MELGLADGRVTSEGTDRERGGDALSLLGPIRRPDLIHPALT